MSRLGYVLALNAESQGRSDAEAPIHGAIASCSESQRGSRLEQDLCKWQVVLWNSLQTCFKLQLFV